MRPVAETDATVAFDDVHVDWLVTSCCEPSDPVVVAVSCDVWPTAVNAVVPAIVTAWVVTGVVGVVGVVVVPVVVVSVGAVALWHATMATRPRQAEIRLTYRRITRAPPRIVARKPVRGVRL
jgi:hypothetical protein